MGPLVQLPMESEDPMPAASPSGRPRFLVGPGRSLYQLFRRAHLSGETLELLRRRISVISLFAWLPLLVLSAVEGHAWGSSVTMPFAYDVDAHVRFLIALPLLVVAELVVHQRMRPVVGQFAERGLIADAARAKFDAALAAALRLRNSVLAEVGLIAFVYGVGVWSSCGRTPRWTCRVGTAPRRRGYGGRRWPAGGSVASACRRSSSFPS